MASGYAKAGGPNRASPAGAVAHLALLPPSPAPDCARNAEQVCSVPKVAAGSAQRAWGGAASAAASSPENLEKRNAQDTWERGDTRLPPRDGPAHNRG